MLVSICIIDWMTRMRRSFNYGKARSLKEDVAEVIGVQIVKGTGGGAYMKMLKLRYQAGGDLCMIRFDGIAQMSQPK